MSESWPICFADSARAIRRIVEGLPQLARFVFLREAWKQLVSEGDRTWIAECIQESESGPGGSIAMAIERLVGGGASPEDLTTVVRVMQRRLLFGLCRLLDEPGSLEHEVGAIDWKLFQVDQDDQPIAAMTGLHESILETAPSGTEKHWLL